MKYVFILIMMSSVLAGVSTNAQAKEPPFVCVTGTETGENEQFEPYFEEVRNTCEQLNRIGNGLEVAKITVELGAIYSACTGVGAPVTVGLQGVVVGLSVIKLVVGNLPCDDMKEQKIEASLKQLVCNAMNQQGIGCQPTSL